MEHVIIIGNGISGVTAARHIRKMSDKRITIISSESEHFFSRTALMYVYMGHMKFEHTKPYENWFWKKNKIDLLHAHVDKIDFRNQNISCNDGKTLAYDTLILALGSKPNKFGWPGQDLQGVQGLYSKQDLELMEKNTRNSESAVIVGGGLIGVEMAEMLHSRKKNVTFLVRENLFWSNVLPEKESKIISDHIRENGIELMFNEELEIITSNDGKRCSGVKTKSGKDIKCDFLGLTVGVSPNIEFLRGSDLNTDRGIIVNNNFETNIKNVYAIGDCAELKDPPVGRSNIEQVWYTGRMHGEVVADNICSKKREYLPGPWFNSAKFFDIEYQTYGRVKPKYSENEKGIYWEDDDHKKCIHIVYDKNTEEVIGINLLGIRHRHEVWNKWISNKTKIRTVLQSLDKANFDPEFYKRNESFLLKVWNEENPDKILEISQKNQFLELIGLK